MKKTIHVPFFEPYIDKQDKNAILKALSSTYLTNGPKLEEFEKNFKKFTGAKYAIGVSNATSALHLALKSLDIGKNDEVIVPNLTFVATANSVLATGATPVIADVEENTMNISPESIRKNLSKRTKAIIPVHFAGVSCDMNSISKIAKKNSITIIEDCAHGIGTFSGKKHVGNFGEIGCFSFYPTKNITTIEGGMIITNNKKIANFVKLSRNHGLTRTLIDRYSSGFPWEYDVKDVGYNYRLDEIRSTLGISQLQKVQQINKKRRSIFLRYNQGLKNISNILCPDEKNLEKNSCHLYIIKIKKTAKISRNNLFKVLQKYGIGCSVHYKPLNELSILKKKSISRDSLSVSKKLSTQILSLPMYPQLTKNKQNYVIQTLKQIFEN